MAGSTSKPGLLQPKKQIELFSGSYFAACTLGGIIGKSLLVTLYDSGLLFL